MKQVKTQIAPDPIPSSSPKDAFLSSFPKTCLPCPSLKTKGKKILSHFMLGILLVTEKQQKQQNPCLWGAATFSVVLIFTQITNTSTVKFITLLIHNPTFLKIRLNARCFSRLQTHRIFRSELPSLVSSLCINTYLHSTLFGFIGPWRHLTFKN